MTFNRQPIFYPPQSLIRFGLLIDLLNFGRGKSVFYKRGHLDVPYSWYYYFYVVHKVSCISE